MSTNSTFAVCGLPGWVGITRNDTVAYINDILLAVVNGSTGTFAFLSNLAIIVAIAKNPSLQKPSNILLCGLASVDCLTGIITQPLFVAWRFFVQGSQHSCSHKVLAWHVLNFFSLLTFGLSFSFIGVISFDRHYALSRPMEYHANATKQGALKVSILISIIWLLFTILIKSALQSSFVRYFVLLSCGVWFLVVPVVNHIRMLFAIRRHNRQVGDAVASQQMSVVLRREKKVAMDMWIVSTILLASLVPPYLVTFIYQTFEIQYPGIYAIALPWTVTMVILTSSINPIFYLARNPNLKTAVRSMLNIQLFSFQWKAT